MENHYDGNGIYQNLGRDECLGSNKPNYWKGSSTKEGISKKDVSKRRKKNKLGRKTKQANRK